MVWSVNNLSCGTAGSAHNSISGCGVNWQVGSSPAVEPLGFACILSLKESSNATNELVEDLIAKLPHPGFQCMRNCDARSSAAK